MSVYTGVTHSRLKAISLEADEATITRLNVTDSVLSTRVRFTIAEVNAGATLVAAITGKSIRMVSCKAIAVGGAAGAVTTVDVLGTVSTARKLVAFAQASLTQSAVLTAGGTGAAVLADGASYTANDVSTGITVGKTGSNVTTATHIDVIFDYVVV
jgi:hypothetical protein